MGGRILAGIVIVGSFGIWGYAYSGLARREPPDIVDHTPFTTDGEAACARAIVDLDALPDALDAVDGPDRAGQIRTSTARLEAMLDELDGLVGGDERDRDISREWLADWRVIISDRYRYADAIETDPDAQYYQSDIGVSERLDRRVTRFATTNQMLSCVAPTDVG